MGKHRKDRLRVTTEGIHGTSFWKFSRDISAAYSDPDPPHNLKSVRSAVFWYWFYLEEYFINVHILLVVRRDRNPNVSSAMKKAVSLKALKNKDQMSVETALEIFHPNVQRAIPAQDVIITLVPEIYTFWRQNRPGNILCPLDITIHKESGSIFFSDHTANQIMKCDLHSPSNQEVLRIERILKGGVDSDIDSEDEASDASDDEQQPVLDYGDVELF
ncbi:hypothetical protein ACROYT_G031481 [Oculina patagonica]